jgi:hypothetical protein
MRQTKIITLNALIILALSGCIENYYPKEIEGNKEKYVVSGQVTSTPGYQYIRVSKTSLITLPTYRPLEGCYVQIIDGQNNTFTAQATDVKGEYSVWIDEEYLYPGNAFKVVVATPEWIFIESEFDTLKACPEIQDVYYKRVDKLTPDPNDIIRGVQFMIDLVADQQHDRFFRWDIEETYEYRATYPITIYWTPDSFAFVEPADMSLFYCWDTKPVKNIYTLSTKGLTENEFKGYNLHFVNNRSQKLMFQYSIYVTQYAISETFYNYLEQLRVNATELGGMFGTQPLNIKGNLSSPDHPDLDILGFFGVSSSTSKRFFYSNIEDLFFELPNYCQPVELDMGIEPFVMLQTLVYFLIDEGQLKWAQQQCFDCRLSGGTIEKPSYMPFIP